MNKFNKIYNTIIQSSVYDAKKLYSSYFYKPSREQIEQIVRKELEKDRNEIKQEDFEGVINEIIDDLFVIKTWGDEEDFMLDFWDSRAEVLNRYKREHSN